MIWLIVIVGLYLMALIVVSWLSLHPFRTPIFISPGALGKAQEDVEFKTRDGIILRGWWSAVPDSKSVAVLSHGYVMNRCELTPLAAQLVDAGCSTLLYDSRAHGKSGGRTCGFGVREAEDVRAAVEFARLRTPNAKVVLIGSSMGAAASAFALGANTDLADALILDSSYSRLSKAISGWWRFLGGTFLSVVLWPVILIASPFARINPFKVDVASAVENIQAPILIVHGDCDNLALPSEAQRNMAACKNSSELVWMPTCGHSEGRWVHPEAYYQAVFGFLRKNGILC